MIRILIADDHAVVREGVKQILSETHDMLVAGEAGDGQEVLRRAESGEYDVIVLDISMPGRSGLEILKTVKERKPDLAVLVLSIHSEDLYAVRAFKAGASGYLTKSSAPDELIAAIRKVSKGGKYVSASLAERLASNLDIDVEKSLHEGLSDREFQVLCMIASGKSVKNIAAELCLSPKTISTYRSRLLGKMKMSTNADIIHYALKNRLVE